MRNPVASLQELQLLYKQDYYRWLEETTKQLQSGELAELDIINLAEEIILRFNCF
jgi:hypothetical protein